MLSGYPHVFKGQKPGIYNSHVAYVPDCPTAMAFYCLVTGDDAHGRQVAAAIANYFKLREKLLDEYLALSDSEFGSSSVDARGVVENWDGNGTRTHWHNIHGFMPNMDLGMALDFGGRWMTPGEKDAMSRIIAKTTYGRRSYAGDGLVRFRDVNWCTWDLPDYMAVTEIERLSGYDPEAAASHADLTYAYSWRWMTQPPQVWNDALKALPWELDPGAENLRNWAGTARYKMRPWWTTYNYVNYLPTNRAPFNPMQYVRRDVALVRGAHPYGVVMDNLKKDDAAHHDAWAAMLNGGVWKADVLGLAVNVAALGFRVGAPNLNLSAAKPPLVPKPGEPA